MPTQKLTTLCCNLQGVGISACLIIEFQTDDGTCEFLAIKRNHEFKIMTVQNLYWV